MFCVLNTHADAAMAWTRKDSAHVHRVESFLSVILSSFEIGRKFYVYPEPPCPGDLNEWSAKRILWSWEFLARWSRSTITRRSENRKYQAVVPLDKFLELHLRDNPLPMSGMLFPRTEFDLPEGVAPLELKDVWTAAMALKTTESPSLGETNKSTSSRSAKADAPPVRDEEVPVASIFNREGKTLSEIWHEILNEGLWSLRVCLDHRTEELAKGDYDTVAKWNFYRIYYLVRLQEFKTSRWVSPDAILNSLIQKFKLYCQLTNTLERLSCSIPSDQTHSFKMRPSVCGYLIGSLLD